MYRPSGPHTIWVPLGRMSWGWIGAATRTGGAWILDPPSGGAHTTINPRGTKTIRFPEWIHGVGPGGDYSWV